MMLNNECQRIDRWWYVNPVPGNGLVPLGNKSLTEPMLANISDAIGRY